MAERNEFVRALRGHRAGDDRGVDHRALRGAKPAARARRKPRAETQARLGASRSGASAASPLTSTIAGGRPRRRATASLCIVIRQCSTSRSCAAARSPRRRLAQFAVTVLAPPPHRAHELDAAPRRSRRRAWRAQIRARRREQAGVEHAVGGQPRARAVAAERLRDGRDEPDLAGAVRIGVTLGDLAAIGRARLVRAASAAAIASRNSRDGTTSPGRQSLRLPTSMYSMKRTHDAGAAEMRARSSTCPSLTPRWMTALTLIGARPASARRADAVQHAVEAVEAAAHAAEGLRDRACRGSP